MDENADPLVRDDDFFAAVQPNTAGTLPGQREAMVIHGGALYVGSADGFVSKFVVDIANKERLQRIKQSERLGHEVFALVHTGAVLIAGTRRRLFKFDPGTLSVMAEVALPWEFGQPHHMAFGEVLPGHAGPELVFASVHGGLVFCDENLNLLHEWTEPGIIDFELNAGGVTILSARGVLANVSFSGSNHAATLTAVSQSIPAQLREHAPAQPDPPCQGDPRDLELMRVNWGAAGANVATISLWSDDEDGVAVRGHWIDALNPVAYLSNLTHTNETDFWIDIATCSEANAEDVGDHCLVLSGGGMLRLWNQYGGLVAQKQLAQTVQGYYPFGAGAHTLCVGELVANSGLYSQEIVVATNTGLMWLHVDDLLSVDAENRLPATGNAQGAWASGFWLDTEKALPTGFDTHVQARTNETMASAWALARRPGTGPSGFDEDLHVLDQRGAYWKVGYDGSTRLYEREGVLGTRGWDYVGPLDVDPNSFNPASSPHLRVLVPGDSALFRTEPWMPIDTLNVIYDNAPTGVGHVLNNWSKRLQAKFSFEGFLVHQDAGGITRAGQGGTPQPDRQAWYWSSQNASYDPVIDRDRGPWGNLLEGLSIPAGGAINGIWVSSNDGTPVSAEIHDRCPYHNLRSYVTGVPIMAQQSVRPVALATGVFQDQTAVVLGCPGGRVRVLIPEAMRTDSVPHGLGNLDESPDLGYGGSALAVRHEHQVVGDEKLVIWLGTVSHPAARPIAYATATASLDDGAVACGAVHRLEWIPGQGFNPTIVSRSFQPTAQQPRGAYAVVGLLETDLEAWSGRELIVATMSGDLIVLDADTMAERWRTRVDGSIGFYNSIVAANLNASSGDTHDEIYVSGSKGLWRFTQQGEG